MPTIPTLDDQQASFEIQKVMNEVALKGNTKSRIASILNYLNTRTGVAWGLNGNNILSSAYLGSINEADLTLIRNAQVYISLLSGGITNITGKVGINTPSPKAALEINSTSDGFLIPRLFQTQIDLIVNPVESLLLFNKDTKKYQFYNNGKWVNFISEEDMTNISLGIKGVATQSNAPTPYTVEAYPDGLFETYVVRTPLTMPNSWGSAVTQEELDANNVYFDVTNGSSTLVLSKKENGDSAYEVAVKNGFIGTESEWLESLKGIVVSEMFDPTTETEAQGGKQISDYIFGYDIGAVTENANAIEVANMMALTVKTPSDGTWIPLVPAYDYDIHINKVSIRGNGIVTLVSVNSDYLNRTEIVDVNLTDTDNVNIISVDFILPKGRTLGMMCTPGKPGGIFYKAPKGINEPDTVIYPSLSITNNVSMAFGYEFTTIPRHVAGKISELLMPFSDKKLLFEDDFSTKKADWIATNWTHDSTNKRWQSSTNGRSNNLLLNRINNFNKKQIFFNVIASADSDFRIETRNSNGAQTGDGESLFGINFSTSKIAIYKANKVAFASEDVETYGVLETEIVEDKITTSPLVGGREYAVEIKYNETINTISITDTLTGSRTELAVNGWIGGRQQQFYSFYRYSGTGSFEIKNVRVSVLDGNYFLGIDGDSIQEGVMVTDKSKRWWKQAEPYIDGKIIVGARGGQSVPDMLDKFDNMWGIIRPKFLMYTVGVNGGDTELNYQRLRDKCLSVGITPIFNYLSSNFNTTNAVIIGAVGLEFMGLKFHVATSLNNDGVNNNSVLFYDAGFHPNNLGNDAMFKRVFVDRKEILK